MTLYLDKLRKSRKQHKSDWVFVNSHGEPYTTSTLCLLVCVFHPSHGALPGAWTHFVKATFAKHSSAAGGHGKKKAPSASLARSIFVTWLNGVPYDTRDSPFLQEMKVTAAEYQTHSLAIANNHYDKDAASEAKLRVLVDFCDAYARWQPDPATAAAATAGAGRAASSGKEAKAADKLSENLDSDDEEVDELAKEAAASAPVAPAAAAALAVLDNDHAGSGPADMQLGNDEGDQPEPASAAPAAFGAGAGAGSGAGSGSASSSIPAASPVLAAATEIRPSRAAKTKAGEALQRSGAGAGAGAGAAAAVEHKEAQGAGPPPKKQRVARQARKPRTSRDARDLSDDSASDSESSTSTSSSSSSDQDSDEEDARIQQAQPDETEYMPDRIVAKKTVGWQNFYLVHWLGFTAAERTWEPAAFFDEYCTKQTYDYEQARRPLRIQSQRPRRIASSSESKRGAAATSSTSLYYEVQWHGQSETTMELAAEMAEEHPDLVKDWEQREAERKSRKRKQPSEVAGSDGGDQAQAAQTVAQA
jgi:hypothetical protein